MLNTISKTSNLRFCVFAFLRFYVKLIYNILYIPCVYCVFIYLTSEKINAKKRNFKNYNLYPTLNIIILGRIYVLVSEIR